MRYVYRWQDNQDYWDSRWSHSGVDKAQFKNKNIYPIKFAEMVVSDASKKVREVGCGLGRVLLHYQNLGIEITGIERSEIAVDKINKQYPKINAQAGDALDMPFTNETFDVVLAFGVYHNLPEGIDKGLEEISRCLTKDGSFCISMRPDNIEMRLNEVYWRWRNRAQSQSEKKFHKVLVKEDEFKSMLGEAGLMTDNIYRSRNVSLLYRLPFLRARQSSEESNRSAGYQLNIVGRIIDKILCTFFPFNTANVIIFIGHKI